ncbi:hypothetical protein SAMN05216327_107349 [Dyadobacter sp. SG02]|nr:hypothetical protein SAMN05216327_107349 [Dyadobacter sp. SG02]
MDEKTTKDIVKASMVHTSDEFVQKLMHQIECKHALRGQFTKAFRVGCSCCLIILMLFATTSYPVSVFTLHFPAFYIKLSAVVIVSCLLNKLIAMKELLSAE